MGKMKPSVLHSFAIERSADRRKWQAGCGCGKRTKWVASAEAARVEWRKHLPPKKGD